MEFFFEQFKSFYCLISLNHHFVGLGGDIVSGDGRGSMSIYGKHFEDENLTVDHTGPGFVGMANSGPDKNGCQFYITTMGSPWLNGKHTIFGKVVNGAAYVHLIEKVKIKQNI